MTPTPSSAYRVPQMDQRRAVATTVDLTMREERMYGCTRAAVDAMIRDSGSPSMLVMSMLSDAQEEEIGAGLQEDARQTINRAKYVISTHLHTR